MAKPYLDPKTVDADSPKRWKKENLELLKRVGFLNLFFICAIAALPATILGWVCLNHPILFIALIPISVSIGIVLTAFHTNVLERARRGMSSSLVEDFSGAVGEIASNGKWFKNTLYKILIFMVLIFSIFGLVVFLASFIDRPEEAQEAASNSVRLVDYTRLMLAHMTLYILALRPGGLMSMSYFLAVKLGVEKDTAEKIEKIGHHRNTGVLSSTSFFIIMAGLAIIFTAIEVGYFMIPLYVIGSIFFAGLNLSAWHDIYDPDGGLAEKQTVREMELAKIPA